VENVNVWGRSKAGRVLVPAPLSPPDHASEQGLTPKSVFPWQFKNLEIVSNRA